MLRGRCGCRLVRIDRRYVIVEGGMAFLAWVLWWKEFEIGSAILWLVFFSFLVVAAGIDWDHMIIPDRISLGGAAVALAAQWLLDNRVAGAIGFSEALLGAVVGAGLLLLIGFAGKLFFRKEAMGFGDVKLMLLIGAMVGWQGVLFVIGSSACIGAMVGLLLMLGSRWQQHGGRLPYGPFLAFGAVLWALGGSVWWEEYFSFLQHIHVLWR